MSIKSITIRKGQIVYYDDETKEIIDPKTFYDLSRIISRVNLMSVKELEQRGLINGNTKRTSEDCTATNA